MNRIYRLHPREYALGETEAFYARMARKGLLLEKRGAYLSRFRKGTPENRKYRIELASPSLLDGETGLPEEQIQLYGECGWEYITSCGLIHVFSAAENSPAPEIYSDPSQQAPTLKALRREYMLSWLPLLFLLLLQLLFSAALSGGENLLTALIFPYQRLWVEYTAAFLAYLFGISALFFCMFYAAYRSGALYRRLRKGIPLDHEGRERHRLHWIPQGILLAFFLVFLGGAIFQWAQADSYPMPLTSDGPYLTLGELGMEGQREESLQGEGSYVKMDTSLKAKQWHTFESVAREGDQCWIYQDIYSFRTSREAKAFLPVLMHTATFANSPSDFTKIQVEDLDEVYNSNLEYIIRKKNIVFFITSADFSLDESHLSSLWKGIARKGNFLLSQSDS